MRKQSIAIVGVILSAAACGTKSDAPGMLNSAVSTQELKIRIAGTGTGSVAFTDSTVAHTCNSASCFYPIPNGNIVALTETPSGTNQFWGWLGDCTGGPAAPCSVTLDSSRSVTAAFSTSGNPPLVVSTVGSGTVTTNPAGTPAINCGVGGAACAAEFAPGTAVNLIATPAAGQTFVGWSGACTGTGACNVTMNQAVGVNAMFSGAMLRMDVVLTGEGLGNVVSAPAGISCGAGLAAGAGKTCGAPFTPGTQVTLTATPKDNKSYFSGWTGACAGSLNTCTVTLDDNKSAGASFARSVGPALVVTTPEPVGANCALGGTRVQAGMDANTNGILDTAEIGWTGYACSTATGTAVVNSTAEPAGANCGYGGWYVTSSVDPTFATYACNPSTSALVPTPGVNATVTSVTPSSATGPIRVRLKLKDDLGNPVSINGSYSMNTAITPKFALAYYTTDVSGNVSPLTVYTKKGTGTTLLPTNFSGATGGGGTLVESGLNAGDYTFTFPASAAACGTSNCSAVQYDPAHVNDAHVVWIEAARQTDLSITAKTGGDGFYATNQPYYFVPAGGLSPAPREIVKAANCYKCHEAKLKIEPSQAAPVHGGSRIDPTYCNVCHNPGRTTNPVANSKSHIHRIHGAANLQPTNIFDGTGAFAFPQTTANCSACHDGALQGAQSMNVPTQIACGSCHDNVKFDGTAAANCSGQMTSGTGYTTGVALNIAASTGTAIPYSSVITRATGSFLTDGYTVGQAVSITGTVSNNVHMQITAVTATTMTLATATKTVAEVSPTTAYINAYSVPVVCNHVGGVQANDTACTSCHTPALIATRHTPVADPDPAATWNGGTNANTNAAWLAASGKVPAGASQFTYDLQSVSTYTDGTGNVRPQATFRILRDGVRADFQTYSAGVTTEIYAGFQGSPSAYFAWAMPQDGVAAPTEFNASASCYVRSAWNGSATGTGACTLTGPDASGYYTVRMTGGAPIAAGATMLTGGIGYTYALSSAPPLTQLNLAAYPTSTCAVPPTGALAGMQCGGLIVPVADVWAVATGYTGRRAIVDNDKCKNCHGALGIEPTFHAGQRNNAPTCSFCHTANRTSSGWAAGSRYYIHAIHGGRLRSTPFTWHAPTPGPGYSEVEYPSPLDDCQTCHLPGTNKLVNANSNLPMTVASGTLAASFTNSPYVTAGTNYGAGYAVSSTTGVATEAAGSTLVISPIATVCSSCHDTATNINHMRTRGGARFYEPRSAYLADVAGGTSEKCRNCHEQLNH